MKHKDIEKLIQKSLDRETTQEQEKMLHSHLSRCHACQELHRELALSSQMVVELVELFPEPGFNERVLRKIAVKKARVWTKAAIVFASVWLSSLVFFAFLPLPREMFNRMLTSTPALVRLYDNIQLIISSLSHTIMPVLKISLNSSLPVMGLILSIMLFYFLGKTLSPVRKLRKDIKPRPKDFLTG